jgi:hypothetical protein
MGEPWKPRNLSTRVKRIAGTLGVPSHCTLGEGYVDIPALELTDVELLGVLGDGMPGRGAADKAGNLAGCKSPYRQLPVLGRLAYLVVATSED